MEDFKKLCRINDLNGIKINYIFKKYKDLNLNEAFQYCADVEIAKWLVSLPEAKFINVHSGNEHAFRKCCHKGYFEMARWLYNSYPNIDIHAENDSAFIASCQMGHLKIAQWLHKLVTDGGEILNVHSYKSAFTESCQSGHLDTAQWLYSLGIIFDTETLIGNSNNSKEVNDWLISLKKYVI